MLYLVIVFLDGYARMHYNLLREHKMVITDVLEDMSDEDDS